MLRKSIPVVLALMLGIAGGFVLANPGLVRLAVSSLFPAPSPKVEATVPELDLKDTVKELLKSKDVQSLIKTVMSDPKIDVRAISEMVAKQVADSPDLKRAIAEQLRSQDTRRALTEVVRTREFKDGVTAILKEPDVKRLVRDMVMESMKEPASSTPAKTR